MSIPAKMILFVLKMFTGVDVSNGVGVINLSASKMLAFLWKRV